MTQENAQENTQTQDAEEVQLLAMQAAEDRQAAESALAEANAKLQAAESVLEEARQTAAKAGKGKADPAPKPEKVLTSKETRKYVTTDKVRQGRLMHPITRVVYTRTSPAAGEGGPFSWIEAQVKAGLMVEYK